VLAPLDPEPPLLDEPVGAPPVLDPPPLLEATPEVLPIALPLLPPLPPLEPEEPVRDPVGAAPDPHAAAIDVTMSMAVADRVARCTRQSLACGLKQGRTISVHVRPCGLAGSKRRPSPPSLPRVGAWGTSATGGGVRLEPPQRCGQ
jgi:hypothetical protein